MSWVRNLPRVFVGAVLLATGLGKVLDIPGFAQVVASYELLPAFGNSLVAFVLPFVELATGLALVLDRGTVVAARVAVGLHAMLVGVVLSALGRGLVIENCGCFGVFLARPLGPSTLVEDLVMLALSALALRFASRARLPSGAALA